METIPSVLNDSPNHSVYYASISADVDLREVGPGTPGATGHGYAAWGFSIGGVGDLVVTQPDGTDQTFLEEELNLRQIYPYQCTGVKTSGSTATHVRFYWRT
jgi:hypothetical protein